MAKNKKYEEKSQSDFKYDKALSIDTTFLHTNPTDFSLAPRDQEQNIEANKCNYYTDRGGDRSIKYIVQTYSVGSLDSTLQKMVFPPNGDITQLRGSGVSVHYLIDEDGTIYNLVPDIKRPWTAGAGGLKAASKLNPGDADVLSMNDVCLSIMCINDGKSPLSQEQVESNITLTSSLSAKYDIPYQQVIGLADWAEGRHIAPGPYFPWQDFSKAGLGLWSNVDRVEDAEIILTYKHKPLSEEIDHVQQSIQELFAKYEGVPEISEFASSISAQLLESGAKVSDSFVTNISQKLTNGLGYVGRANGRDTGYLDSALLTNMLTFNLHHLGKQIQNSGLKDVYDSGLWTDSGDADARGALGEWTTNSQAVLDDLLDM